MKPTIFAMLVLVMGCGREEPAPSDGGLDSDEAMDTGALDGGALDGGALDGGALDGGALDTSQPDASQPDAPIDAHIPLGGADTGPDAGADAPPPACPDVDLGSAVGADLWSGSPWTSAFTAAVCLEGERGALRLAWRAPGSGPYVVSVSAPYGAVELWTGCDGTELACDGAGRIAFDATAGEDFVFFISAADSNPLSVTIVGALSEERDCANAFDDDFDGAVDCSDDDCFDLFPCVEICDDGIDNNGNGAVDCDDRDWCGRVLGCYEICDNGADDDHDALVDCDDPNCEVFPACTIAHPCHGYICPGHAPLCLECAGAPVCVTHGGTCP